MVSEQTNASSERPEPSPRPPAAIKPVKKKVGEPADNLRRREQWYQRRAGGQSKRPAS